MKKSPFLVFILPTLGFLAVGMVVTRNFANSPPVSLHSSLQSDGLSQRALLAEKEISSAAGTESVSGVKGKLKQETPVPASVVQKPRRWPTPDYDKLITPFIEELKEGELGEAEETLTKIEKKIPQSIYSALQFSLESARETRRVKATANAEREQRDLALAMVEAEKERRVRSVAEAKEETEKVDKVRIEVEQHLVKMQSDNADQILTSIEELNQAAEAARAAAMKAAESVQETARLMASSAKVEVTTDPLPVLESLEPEAKLEVTSTAPAKEIILPETESISFGSNSSTVSHEFDTILNKVSSELKEQPEIDVELRGFTDSLGDPKYNEALSKKRAENVKVALLKRGVSAGQIKVIPLGATKSKGEKSANLRRVDLVFVLGDET